MYRHQSSYDDDKTYNAFISKVGVAATGSNDGAAQSPIGIATAPSPPHAGDAGDQDLPQVDPGLTINIDGSVLQNEHQTDPLTYINRFSFIFII